MDKYQQDLEDAIKAYNEAMVEAEEAREAESQAHLVRIRASDLATQKRLDMDRALTALIKARR